MTEAMDATMLFLLTLRKTSQSICCFGRFAYCALFILLDLHKEIIGIFLRIVGR